MILAFPGTSTAVLCWVSFKWIFPTLVYVSDVWDLLLVSLILLKDRSDPMEVALLHLLVAYRPFHPPLQPMLLPDSELGGQNQQMPLIWTKPFVISPLSLPTLGTFKIISLPSFLSPPWLCPNSAGSPHVHCRLFWYCSHSKGTQPTIWQLPSLPTPSPGCT